MKALGGVIVSAGVVLIGIALIWGRAGYYLHEGPILIGLALGGAALAALGGVILQRGSRGAPVPPGARSYSQATPVAAVAPAVVAGELAGNPLAAAASDPATPLEQLADLAHRHPDLRPLIVANPSTYPDLLNWLGALGDPAVAAAFAERTAARAVQDRAGDPSTDPAVLAQLAYDHPELRATIAENPAAYPALLDWIAVAGLASRAVDPAPAVASAVVAAPVRPPRAFWTTANTIAVVSIALVSAVAAGVGVTTGSAALGIVAQLVAQPGALGTQSGMTGGNGATGGGGTTGGDGPGTGNEEPLAGGSSPAARPSEPRYVPTVLILDASGSMVRQTPEGGTRMAAARDAAITFVNGLGDEAQIGLTVFGTGTGNDDSEQAAGCRDVKRVIPVGPVDKEQLTDAISGIAESGFTPLGPSIVDAAQQLAGHAQGLVILVSDGVDTCSPPPACDVATSVRAEYPGLTIHAIGFNVDADEQVQEQLQCIARVGGGEYVSAASAAQLAARLRVLSDPVSTAGSLTARGIDTLRLGMSVEQAMAADPSIMLGETVLDIRYAICDTGRLLFKAGRLWAIEPEETVATAEGVRVGDGLALVRELYGPGQTATDGDGTYLQVPAASGSDSGYRFYTGPGDTVIRIVICICGPGGGAVSEITNWQLGFDGVGPVRFGTRVEDALGLVTVARPTARVPGCGIVDLATSGVGAGVALTFDPTNNDPTVDGIVVDGRGLRDDLMPRTAAGVGLGSTIAEVSAAYTDLTLVTSERYGTYGVVTSPVGRSMLFVFNEDQVLGLTVWDRPMPLYERDC